MTGYELHDLLANNLELTSDTWSYFLTVHLAIFGVVYIANRRIGLFDRLILLVAYAGVLVLNYRAQIDNFTYQAAVKAEIAALGEDGASKALLQGDTMWVLEYLAVLYAVAAILATVIILFTNKRADD